MKPTCALTQLMMITIRAVVFLMFVGGFYSLTAQTDSTFCDAELRREFAQPSEITSSNNSSYNHSINLIWSKVATIVINSEPFKVDNTGVEDASLGIQRALDKAHEKQGGVVYLPKGSYRINSSISIKETVSLIGERNADGTPAAILLAYGMRGELKGALISGEAETAIEAIGIYYPEQSPDNIVAYPPTIGGSLNKVKDVILYNSYIGFDSSVYNLGSIENLKGTVLAKGISTMFSCEFSWMRDVDFSPIYWKTAPIGSKCSEDQNRKISKYIENNLIGFEFGRIDLMAIQNISAIGAKIPVLIRQNPEYLNLTNGFGAVVVDIPSKIREEGIGAYYYGLHYSNVRNVKETLGKSYVFPKDPLPQKIEEASFFNVKIVDFGAKGDGVTDDTQAIQQALLSAKNYGGGTVFLPNGNYKITQPLTIPSGVELRGTHGTNRGRDFHPACSLQLYHGANTLDPDNETAGINLSPSSGIRGFTLHHPQQKFDFENNLLVKYPYAVRGAGSNIWIKDITFLNAYNGIDFGKNKCDHHLIRGIWGTIYHKGIVISGGSVGGTVERVCISWALATLILDKNCTWDGQGRSPVTTYFKNNATPYSFGNCQNQKAWGLAAFNSSSGIIFYADNGLAADNLNIWLTMLDVPISYSIKAEQGKNINLYGILSTYHNSPNNWLLVNKEFRGPLNIVAKALMQPYIHKPYDFSKSQVRFYDEISLATKKNCLASARSHKSNPSHAFDGEATTYWQFPKDSYLQVDLGSIKNINRFSIEPYKFSGHVSYRNYGPEIFVSKDNVKYSKVNLLDLNNSGVDHPFDKTHQARFVRLYIKNPDPDGLFRISSFNIFENNCLE